MPINAWSIEDVRAAEAATMAQLPDGELMARAAHGLAMVVGARLDDVPDARVVVLVGSGGNGGDALFAAAELTGDASGVVAVLLGAQVHGPALEAAREAGVLLVEATTPQGLVEAHEALAEADVVVDGITGIGGRPGLAQGHPLAWELVEAIPSDAYVVAVDLPSGADPTGERIVPDAVWADETVTFGVAKPVHVLAGAPACGLLTVIDIGLDLGSEEVDGAVGPAAVRLGHDDIAALWPVPGPEDDKYSRGVLGVVAGGENYTGAAVLSVLAAVCAGAGMVRYVGPPGPSGLVRAQVPEAVHGDGRVQAWLVGPGLEAAPQAGDEAGDEPADEVGAAQVAAARVALHSDLPCVVDAGGLDLLDGPRRAAGARTLLTPHAGELARLLTRLDSTDGAREGVGDDPVAAADGVTGSDGVAGSDGVTGSDGEVTVEAVRADPVGHARRAARLLHATVLLKGSTTYIVPPSDALPVYAQADAPAWLGTAGSGDVLAGLAGMLLAAGLDPLETGALAAIVHGLAGHEANPDGPVRALDVAHAIPRVVAAAMRRIGG